MIKKTILSDRDSQDDQFRFYDISQHMHSSKDICKKRQPLLGPLLKGPAPILFLGIDRKVLSFPTSFIQQMIKNYLPFLKYVRQKLLRTDP